MPDLQRCKHFVCKYCHMRFTRDLPRYLSHLHHHELHIKPYWYSNPRLSPKAGCVKLKRNDQRTDGTPKLATNDYRLVSNTPKRLHSCSKQLEVKLSCINADLFKCQFCCQFFASENAKKQHETVTHNRKTTLKRSNFKFPSQKRSPEVLHKGEKPIPGVHRSKHYLVCKYCHMRFYRNLPRYLSHIHNHELHIKPYWYSNSYLSPKAGCIKLRQNGRRINGTPKLATNDQRLNLYEPEQRQLCKKYLHVKVSHINTDLLKCQFCSKFFASPNYKKEHEMSHNKQTTLKCSYCDKSFKFLSQKQSHEANHTGGKRMLGLHNRKHDFVCKYCHMRFHKNLPRYLSHIHNHELHIKPYWYKNPCLSPKAGSVKLKRNDQRSNATLKLASKDHEPAYRLQVKISRINANLLKCQFCNKMFATVHSKSKHEMTHKQASLQCSYCEKSFKCLSQKQSHEVIHTGKKAFQCSYCDKTCSTVANKRQHEMTHTGEKPYKCSYCDKHFRSRCNRKDHETLHTGAKPYKCSFCDMSFRLHSQWTYHEKIHTGEKPYTCSYCKKSFSRLGGLKQHELTHTGEKPYECSECHQWFSKQTTLKRHELIHAGDKPHKCKSCDKSFRQITTLRQHEMTHTDARPHKCSLCDKSFQLRAHKNRHELTHTDNKEKQYKCSHCDKSFNRSDGLKVHEKTHTGEKLFKCKYCDKSFLTSGALCSHEKIHRGEVKKMHRCSFCSKAFAARVHKISHERIHTGERPYICTQCNNSYISMRSLQMHQKKLKHRGTYIDL